MKTIQIQIEIPEGLEEKYLELFEKMIKRLELLVFAEILKDILEKSELDEKKALELSEEIKEDIFRRYANYFRY